MPADFNDNDQKIKEMMLVRRNAGLINQSYFSWHGLPCQGQGLSL